MNFGLSDTQQAIKDSAREFFEKETRIADVRRLIDSDTAIDASLWRKIAGQGYTGVIFPETSDGVGLGLVEMAAILEEMGRALLPGPFPGTVLFAGSLLNEAGSDAQMQMYLAPICRGEMLGAVALLEKSASWDPAAVRLAARKTPGGYELRGEKLFVPDAAAATVVIAVVRVDSQLALCCVPAAAPGLQVTPTPGIDLTRRLYRVEFDGVHVAEENVLAVGDTALAALERALDVTTVGLAAEMVGGMQQLLDLTLAYAKTRQQFGRPIGSYQAVQHRCVDQLILLEGSRSAAYYAAWALEHHAADARVAVSVAKAYASDAFREVGNVAIQVQGGMGFTWENDAHLYYRRARGSELACGDASFHRERIARSLISTS
jgi:alkylation response protein AidB-like acyl-CoA dehydrogenase